MVTRCSLPRLFQRVSQILAQIIGKSGNTNTPQRHCPFRTQVRRLSLLEYQSHKLLKQVRKLLPFGVYFAHTD